MLNPHDRTTLFEALRPPPGFRFDIGVGTSFTLNLEALLTAPIAFALFDASTEASASTDETPKQKASKTSQDVSLEPVGLLESIRRYAERVTVFCQAGQIALPMSSRTIYAWLESSVVEVSAPGPNRLFHPKLWLCRYVSSTGSESVLRLLCATRNLSLDSSLDTILVLDSDAHAGRLAGSVANQQGIADFVAALPTLSSTGVSSNRRSQIEELVADVRSVPLLLPEPFTDASFHILGTTPARDVFPAASERAVVISPFVGQKFLGDLTGEHHVDLLLSREAALDRIDPKVLRRIGRVATLSPNAGFDVDDVSDVGGLSHGGDSQTSQSADARPQLERETESPSTVLGGLHAKLFAFDVGGRTHVFTGSANATDAAFAGNVEVMVELVCPSKVGLRALLEETSGEIGFDDLCIDYDIPDVPVEVDDDAEKVALSLDWMRHRIAKIGIQATVESGDDGYRLHLTSDEPIPEIVADHCSVSIWPTSLSENLSAVAVVTGSLLDVTFTVSLEGITSFIAIRVAAESDGAKAETVFVVNAVLSDAPADRHSKLLAAMLRDRDRLLRYLLLLLSDDSIEGLDPSDGNSANWIGKWGSGGWEDVPLLELLVRAAGRYPERLDHINALLADLGDSREGAVPEGFESIWAPVWEYRSRQR